MLKPGDVDVTLPRLFQQPLTVAAFTLRVKSNDNAGYKLVAVFVCVFHFVNDHGTE